MKNSKQFAGLVGPTIVAMVVSEFPLVQPHLYDTQIPSVIYLSAVAIFVCGLAFVRAHNRWERSWPLLLTVSGWSFLLLGLFRMVAAGFYQQCAASTAAATFMVMEGALLVVGLFLSYMGYRPDDR